jgi:hypothetical protein
VLACAGQCEALFLLCISPVFARSVPLEPLSHGILRSGGAARLINAQKSSDTTKRQR